MRQEPHDGPTLRFGRPQYDVTDAPNIGLPTTVQWHLVHLGHLETMTDRDARLVSISCRLGDAR